MLLGALANISDKPLQGCGYILPPSLLGPACSGGQEPLVVVISVSQPAQRSGGPWPMPRTHLILRLQARFSGFLSSAGRPRSGELSCQQEELLRLDVVWPLLTASKHAHIDKRYMSSATDPTRSSDHYELLICACCVRAFRDAQQCTGHCAWTACSVPPIRELNDPQLFVTVLLLFRRRRQVDLKRQFGRLLYVAIINGRSWFRSRAAIDLKRSLVVLQVGGNRCNLTAPWRCRHVYYNLADLVV